MRLGIIFKRLNHGVPNMPAYESEGASGIDIRSSAPEAVEIPPGNHVIIPTGYSCALPNLEGLIPIECAMEFQVRSRSGLAAKHGIFVLNSPGTIDSDYRGEIKIILANFSSDNFVVYRGDRIAQLVPTIVPIVDVLLSTQLPKTKRGSDGLGSTGIE